MVPLIGQPNSAFNRRCLEMRDRPNGRPVFWVLSCTTDEEFSMMNPTFLFTDILTGCDDIRTSCTVLMEFRSNLCPTYSPRIKENFGHVCKFAYFYRSIIFSSTFIRLVVNDNIHIKYFITNLLILILASPINADNSKST